MLHFYAVSELKNLGVHVYKGARYWPWWENKSIVTCVQKSTIFVPVYLYRTVSAPSQIW